MPPGGEPLQGMGRDLQGDDTGEAQGRNGQRHGTHASGTQIRNNQKSTEENENHLFLR